MFQKKMLFFMSVFLLIGSFSFASEKVDFESLYSKAKSGDAFAMQELGDYYRSELHNQSEANKWYLKSADNGNIDAKYIYAFALHQGSGVSPNQKKACAMFEETVGGIKNQALKANATAWIGSCISRGFSPSNNFKVDNKLAFNKYDEACMSGSDTGCCFALETYASTGDTPKAKKAMGKCDNTSIQEDIKLRYPIFN